MNLEEMHGLPQEVVDGLSDELKNLKIYLVHEYDLNLLKRVVDFSLDIFGDGGMDEWGIVPQIRQGNVFVLKEEGAQKIAGLAILMRDWDDVDKVYLFDFAISQEYQGQGLGYHFLHGIISIMVEQGFKRMNLTVNINNPGAIKLYKEKLGFQTLSMKKDEFGKDEHRYFMELDFDDFKRIKNR